MTNVNKETDLSQKTKKQKKKKKAWQAYYSKSEAVEEWAIKHTL